MRRQLRNVVLYCATLGSLLLPAAAAATELGDFCWLTDRGTRLRLSLTQTGTSNYTYTGLFDDGDGVSFAIIGEVSTAGGSILGSFSGSKSTASNFKTGIWQVSFSPTLVGSAEGIGQVYDRATQTVATVYRTHSLAPTPCL